MTGAAHALAAEWERLEALARLLGESRQGRPAGEAELAELIRLQAAVQAARQNGSPLAAAGNGQLSSLELDLLAAALAPEAEPRLGFLFQALQPGSPQPYPTPALVQELLALDPELAGELYRSLGEGAPLRRQGLLEIADAEPFEPLRPARGLAARLLGRAGPAPMPPGTRLVAARPGWDELVLPAPALAQLRELLLFLRHRELVFGQWQARASGGPLALFCGPSGTGKTFAAAVLAADLGWPLYRVDLGQLVSKYVGETEKNLNRLFDAADGREMFLQFDEADSLFGKRGEIREARDRYANLEVSHLLARVEAHRGPCILTTNLRRNLDPAFSRRFQAVIDFPRPDAAGRAELWRRLLPPKAPRAADLDPEILAAAVNLTGGGIRNAALHAAFLAAGDGAPIALRHAALAVWRELGKEGRELSRRDLGPLALHLSDGGTAC